MADDRRVAVVVTIVAAESVDESFRAAVARGVAAARAGLDLPGLDTAEGRSPEDFTSGAASRGNSSSTVYS